MSLPGSRAQGSEEQLPSCAFMVNLAFFLRESSTLGIFLGIFLGIGQGLCGTACPTSASTASSSSSVESQMTMGLCDPSSRLSPAPSLPLRLSLPCSHSLSRSRIRMGPLHRSVDSGVLLCVSCPPGNTPNIRLLAPNTICACGPWRRVVGSADVRTARTSISALLCAQTSQKSKRDLLCRQKKPTIEVQ